MGGYQISESEIHRRDFLMSALAVAGIPPLCCTTEELPSVSVEFGNGKIIVDLARTPELRRTGAAFRIVDGERKVNLILIHAGRGEYAAMDRSCTHGGAQCTYNPKHRTVQCTSLNHAEYDLEGRLLHGRTHGNLRSYPTQLSGSKLEITLERSA